MGGASSTIEAPTKSELKRLAKQWLRDAKAAGLTDIRLGYDPKRAQQTDGGYTIQLSAHT